MPSENLNCWFPQDVLNQLRAEVNQRGTSLNAVVTNRVIQSVRHPAPVALTKRQTLMLEFKALEEKISAALDEESECDCGCKD